MTIIEENDNGSNEMWNRWQQNHRRGKIAGGILVMIAGLLFLGKEMGAAIPQWIFSWQMFLIVLGVFIGVKHAFRNFSWFILIVVGSVFLLREYTPELEFTRYLWPVTIILIGFFMLIRPRRKHHDEWRKWKQMRRRGCINYEGNESFNNDKIDISAVFGSVKKNILSKSFKGGEVNAVFGGAEINMSQADIQGTIELEVNQVFGGTRLIIPANWEIQSELSAILGSVEDKRRLNTTPAGDGSKVLVLKGAAVFGGIEIQSF